MGLWFSRTSSCCGFGELQVLAKDPAKRFNPNFSGTHNPDSDAYQCPDEDQIRSDMKKALREARTVYRGVIVTLNQRQFSAVPVLMKTFGFRAVMSGANPNTGHKIKMLCLTFKPPRRKVKSVFQRARYRG